MTAQLLEVCELSRVFRTPAGPVTALRHADLRIDRGEMVAIMGPSGSGKSTLLHILGLMDRPSSGTHYLDGIDVLSLTERERSRLRSASLGFVFQAFHLVEHRNVVDNVQLPLVYQGTPRRLRRHQALEMLGQVGLLHREEAKPATLSGGERQRVAIARAMVHGPDLLLCDEPTGSLDRGNATQVLSILREAVDRNLAVLVVTHDAQVAAVADRVAVMDDGILAQSNPAAAASIGALE